MTLHGALLNTFRASKIIRCLEALLWDGGPGTLMRSDSDSKAPRKWPIRLTLLHDEDSQDTCPGVFVPARICLS